MIASSAADEKQARYIEGSLAVNSTPEMLTKGKKAYRLKSADDIKSRYQGVRTGDMEGNVACASLLYVDVHSTHIDLHFQTSTRQAGGLTLGKR